MNIETVNELIASLESAGELSIREQKFLKLAKAFKQMAAENVALSKDAQRYRFIRERDMFGSDNESGLLSWEELAELECNEFDDALDARISHPSTGFIELDAKLQARKTPATDRIVAGIKANGVEWIEGNEPSEFGRYWVRYETDTGPQYCSAKWMEYNFCASSDTNIHKIWLADHSRSINSLKGVTHYTKLPAALEGGAL
ncbi:hypothetical protein HPO73_04045 [Klebsiella variicola]|uniref:hypothetical protein n=1 Tax=Klebsiella variicola TaxID=244366 RepID=UPI0016617368|nr:hypothetical protein [Klebsiella variicola]MBD0758890.1 hypothetical protein [Klebsiella variicola]